MVILKTYFYPLLFVSLFFICEQKLKHIEWLWLHINKKKQPRYVTHSLITCLDGHVTLTDAVFVSIIR